MLFRMNICAIITGAHAELRVGSEFCNAAEPCSTILIVQTVEGAIGVT